jgi:DtxR family Mn-dependent transcriptional regulator
MKESKRTQHGRPTAELTQSSEDYLKAIYKLQTAGGVSTKDIASALGVAAASVTNMVKRLADMKLVEYRSYRGVRLTDLGEKAALETIRHHRLLETYLREVMGYPWDQMHDEAERLEHHISEAFEDKIDEMLGYPTHDPHGHPIPARDGSIRTETTTPLSEVATGRAVVIHHIEDTDPEILDYLEQIGLLPRTPVTIEEKAPFSGPITIRVADRRELLGHKVAGGIFVVEQKRGESA